MCNTYMGELSRMTQFKEKSARYTENINAGLFTYPVLMAADILIYQAKYIPVGADQKQHVELTRDIAIRFNNTYGETFVVPEPYIPKVGARIMSLQEPDKKMSKSDPNPNGYIRILDEPDAIVKKLKRAVTDSEGEITGNPERAGVYNLLSIYSACTGGSIEEAVAHFEGKGYGNLKSGVAEAVVEKLRPIQAEYARLLADKAHLNETMKAGAERASATARTIRCCGTGAQKWPPATAIRAGISKPSPPDWPKPCSTAFPPATTGHDFDLIMAPDRSSFVANTR